MHTSLALSLLLAPLLAQAAPSGRRGGCKKHTHTQIVTYTMPNGNSGVQSEHPASDVLEATPSGTVLSNINPSGQLMHPASDAAVTTLADDSTTTVTYVVTRTEIPGEHQQATATASAAVSVETSAQDLVLSSATAVEQSTAVKGAATQTSDKYADATPTSVNVAAKTQCGTDDRVNLPGMPWSVANSMYNADQMQGTQCTNFNGVLEASDGTLLVNWTSTTNIDNVADTADVTKGYSNVAIGPNLQTPLSDIKSIPVYYKWDRTINGEFKGSNIYDFITAPTKGAGEATGSNEFMLFLKIWGGQVPIGYADGPVATFDLYGTTWKMYQGPNTAHGQTVRSLIPDTPFEGEFSGDLKEWMDAMVQKGYHKETDYLNVGNCGIEMFYGDSHMDSTVAMNVNV